MKFSEIVQESTLGLTAHKVRTSLAVLGVVIGIASVIALMGLGQASQKNITSNIQALGSNLLTVMPGSFSSGGVKSEFGGATTLTLQDSQALTEISLVARVAPYVSGNSQVTAGRNNINSNIIGVTPDYIQIYSLELSAGSFITEAQNNSLGRVAVLGPNVVEDLFGENVNPVGQNIRLNSQVLKIIGVTVSKGGMGRSGSDDSIFVPLTTAQKVLFGQDNLSGLGLSVVDEKSMEPAQNQVETLLLKRHKISNADEADFRIMSQEDLLSTVSEVTGTFTTLLAGIAAISLVVGGIGIMNIMLVTVTERTREIGLRKALGAKKHTIIYQFLTEAVLITFIGGVVGIIIGLLASLVITHFMRLPFTIAPISIILAFGVSGIIGIVFGWYPARQAAQLQPIEALRYE